MPKKAQRAKTNTINTPDIFMSLPERIISYRPSKIVYLIALLIGILLLATYKKGWFVAAMVNSSPVSNLELQMRLNKQFHGQILNQMINEKIILDEAVKSNALATEEEVDKKISEVEASVGGSEALNTLLTQQGQTKDSIRNQIRIQLSIEKLYSNQATVSAEEVDKFLETSRETLKATDSATQRKEAEDLLKQQKLSQIFSGKFQELREKAKIQIF